MQIVSYRGQSHGGGVAALIKAALPHERTFLWWHLVDTSLQTLSAGGASRAASIPAAIIDGHYRYCNEFLWPLMHERPDLARYVPEHHVDYRSLNIAVAAHLNWRNRWQRTFIHDYQFGLMPEYLADEAASQSVFFWHIPWPARFPSGTEPQVMEVARALLRCGRVGFHIKDYVSNFCAFVRDFLPEYRVLPGESAVIHDCGRATELIASPAGMDSSFWRNAAEAARARRPHPGRYILSVDRADYTKGIVERIKAVENIFRSQPELQGELQFVFACQPTRSGLTAFDEYWRQCRLAYRQTLERLGREDWSPIVWLADPLAPEELAAWYAHAAAMLVNPSVDGLNLTAKEFVASATDPESVLILSSGAGVWRELGSHSVTIQRCCPGDIAEAVLTALAQPPAHRRASMSVLKRAVRANSLQNWWHGLVSSPPWRAVDSDCVRSSA